MSIHIQVENSKCGLQECLWNVDGSYPRTAMNSLGCILKLINLKTLLKHNLHITKCIHFGYIVLMSLGKCLHSWSRHQNILQSGVRLSHSAVSDSLVTPWTVALQAPLSVEIFQTRIPEWITISSSRRSS